MRIDEYFLGIDGCKSGWFYVGISKSDRYHFGIFERFAAITELPKQPKLTLVDIPIGLLNNADKERLCDKAARRAISPRGSTVFPAPARAAISKDSYTAASEENFRRLGRKLSRQSWAIALKIADVDDFMCEYRESSRIREMHPEVAFWALNHKTPLRTNKKRREGHEERIRVLARHYPAAPACFEEARRSFTRKQVADDDILDALVGAVTARYFDRLATLPEHPERDEFGLPMEMVYADLACLFCEPAPEHVIFDEGPVQCLWDAYPVSPGHALVIPRRHVETWFEAAADEKAAMIEAIESVKRIIEQKYHPTAYNIGVNSGRDAGQTVPHLHLHVIPRYKGDLEDPRGGIRNILPAKAKWWERG